MGALDVGLAISTVGRPQLPELLSSAAASTRPPLAVAIADQSSGGLALDLSAYPFPVDLVQSAGGVSAGRNDALRVLGTSVDVVGFPNDDSLLTPETLEQVERTFRADPTVVAVACSLVEQDGPRFRLPPAGTVLDRRTVWRAIEPATFFRASAVRAAGGFREDMGSGSASPWQSGEGTDLLLRLHEQGGCLLSRSDLVVRGRGERRDLSDDALVAKQRGYARGTGYVYRNHDYPWRLRWRTVLGPWRHPASHERPLRLSLRIAWARSFGRVEGLLATTWPSRLGR